MSPFSSVKTAIFLEEANYEQEQKSKKSCLYEKKVLLITFLASVMFNYSSTDNRTLIFSPQPYIPALLQRSGGLFFGAGYAENIELNMYFLSLFYWMS